MCDCRKRFGIPSDWFAERASQENDRSSQQFSGSGQYTASDATDDSDAPQHAL